MPSSQLFPKWGSLTAGTEGVSAARTMIWEKTHKKQKKRTTWPSTHQSVNSGSLFHPQEVIKAFRWSTGDLEPFLRHEGHGDQLSFGGGGPAGSGRVRSVGTLLHVSPSSQSCSPSIGKSMLIHSEVELLLSGFIV